MAIRPIVVVPHTALKTRAEEIVNIDDRIRALARDMADTMYKAPGIGLAANQVAEAVRLIVLDVEYAHADAKDRKKNPIFIVNPEITLLEGECIREEGCLSVPEFTVEITRPEVVRVTGVDLDGNPVKIDTGGLLARALQHEVDHLNGTTVLEHASTLKRSLYRRKMKKAARRET
jgi:peptide deformylase